VESQATAAQYILLLSGVIVFYLHRQEEDTIAITDYLARKRALVMNKLTEERLQRQVLLHVRIILRKCCLHSYHVTPVAIFSSTTRCCAFSS
jgi:hypothetical protein